MKRIASLSVVAALAASVQLASAGDVTGKITLKGTPPPSPQLTFDPACGKMHAGPVLMPFFVVGKGGELADVFVYLKSGPGIDGKGFPAPGTAAKLDQKGCVYEPYVLGVQTGQTIEVSNSDPVLHNVHGIPTKPGNKESNNAQLPKGPVIKLSYPSEEVFVRVKCDVHPWMFTYVGVVPHPFFAVSGTDGSFTIKNVPPGKYVIEAVHRKTHPGGKGITQEITVGAGGAKADFTIEVAK